MEKVLYIGDSIKKNGPSNVDIRVRSIAKDRINFIEASNFRGVFRELKLMLDCSCCHSSNVNFKGLLFFGLAWLLGIKRTLLLHGSKLDEGDYAKIKTRRYVLEFFMILLANDLAFVSSKLKEQIITRYPFVENKKRCIICPNPIKYNQYQDFYGDKNAIVAIGGGRKEKGILSLCYVIKKLNQEGSKSFKLHVFGEDGEDTYAIKSFDFVNYHGFCEQNEVTRCLSDSAFFIQNSYQESFSLSLFEALNRGCIVLCSYEVGALEFISDHPCIFKFPVSDLDVIAETIEQAYDLPRNSVFQKFLMLDDHKVLESYNKLWYSV